MKILLDTNVLIPLEPGKLQDVEPTTQASTDLFRTAQQVGATLFLHPIQKLDIQSDRDDQRRQLRLILFNKYPLLPNPPAPSNSLFELFGGPKEPSNDWIDLHLIAALERNLVSVLITEDEKLRKRCNRINLGSRCLSIQQGLEVLQDELPATPSPLPAIRMLYAHELDQRDPIFESFRADYPGFDSWLTKCCQQHRQCWVVELRGHSGYAGVCIVNPENREWQDAHNPTLKICTFKIGESAVGMKLGELLLRAVFEYAHANKFATLFLETFPKHASLIHLLNCFGFHQNAYKSSDSGEMELRKVIKPWDDAHGLQPLEFHIRFGPHKLRFDGVNIHIVPIEPRFHSMLFPELEAQKQFWPGNESCGNTVRKAYICNSRTKSLTPGDILLFYRSHDLHAVTQVGVVEETLRTNSAKELAMFANKRTVYGTRELEEKTASRTALGILFRHAPILKAPLHIETLKTHRILKSAPQQIYKLPTETHEWIRSQVM